MTEDFDEPDDDYDQPSPLYEVLSDEIHPLLLVLMILVAAAAGGALGWAYSQRTHHSGRYELVTNTRGEHLYLDDGRPVYVEKP